MSTARDKQIFDLWRAVAELPPDQRESFLVRYCGADTSLIADVFAFERQRAGGQAPPTAGADTLASTPPAPARWLAPGMVLHDRYRIVRVVGGGGMGTVYEAVDLRLRSVVAVKQMIATGGEADRAFEREASLLASIRHPSIPVVIDYFLEESGRFLVMQYIDGDDLSLILDRQGGPCVVEDVLVWAAALLRALEYLHSHIPPIVHRDIKPSNVRRTPRGELVLLDFGLAKGSTAASDSSATVERSVFGYTPSYSPLEQLNGRGTTPQSDLYALGATLYHLATATKPPNARERSSALAGGGSDPLVNPVQLNPALPPGFGSALAQAMALDPGDRFASATAMRAALAGEVADVTAAPRQAPVRDRRVDAAIPSHAEVGRQIDLVAQVRFGESPRLGLEDFPPRRRPAAIEQSSETVRVTYPVDPRTGASLPTRLRLRLVAPDFAIHGDGERTIEVPPDDYSTRVTFMLSALRPGWCRLNVEVYGPEALYLGAIPLESEAVAAAASLAETRVANLVLSLTVTERAMPPAGAAPTLDLPPTAPPRPSPEAAGRSAAEPASRGAVADDGSGEGDDTQQIAVSRPAAVRGAWGGRSLGVVLAVFVLTAITVWRAGPFATTPKIVQTNPPATLATAPAPSTAPADSQPPIPAGSVAPPAMPPPPTASAKSRPPLPPASAPQAGSTSPLPPVATQPPAFASTIPAITAEQDVRSEIRQLVASYCASFETLNARIVHQVSPPTDVAALQRRFARYASLKCSIVDPVEFERLDVSSTGAAAQVRFRMRQMARVRDEGEPRTEDSVVTMVISRRGATAPWQIDRAQSGAFAPADGERSPATLQEGRRRCSDADAAFALARNGAAISAYEDVLRLLPPTDPCYARALERLRVLRK